MQLWGFEKSYQKYQKGFFQISIPGLNVPRAVVEPIATLTRSENIEWLRSTFPDSASALTERATDQQLQAAISDARGKINRLALGDQGSATTRLDAIEHSLLPRSVPRTGGPGGGRVDPQAQQPTTPPGIPTTQAYDNYQQALRTAQGELRESRHNDYDLLTRAYTATNRNPPNVDLGAPDAYNDALIGLTDNLSDSITPEQRGQLERLQQSLGRNELRREGLRTVVYNAIRGVHPDASDEVLEEKTHDLESTHVESDTNRTTAREGDVPAPARPEGANSASGASSGSAGATAAGVIGGFFGGAATIVAGLGALYIAGRNADNQGRLASNNTMAFLASELAQASARATEMSQVMMLQMSQMGNRNAAGLRDFVVAMRPQHPRVSLGAMAEEILPNSPTRPSSLSASSRV